MTTKKTGSGSGNRTAKTDRAAGSSRAVANPNSSGNNTFWWALGALLLIGALVIGLIVYNGRGAKADRIAEQTESIDGVSVTYANNVVTLSPKDGTGKKAALFEDFSCSYCAQLSRETDAEMIKNIEDGKLTVDIYPLTFLDGSGVTYMEGHSTRALAATLALIERDEMQAYWNLRKLLMEQQQTVYNSDNDKLADYAKDFGASKEAIEDIRNGKYMEQAREVGDANAKYLQDTTGELSSPRVLVDGKDVESNPLSDWMKDLLK